MSIRGGEYTEFSSQEFESNQVRSTSHVVVIQFRRNMGKALALAAEFAGASGDVVITIDADLQDDPSEMQRLLAQIELDFDFVFGQGNVNEITSQSPSYSGSDSIELSTNRRGHRA